MDPVIDQWLLDILVCPETKAPLVLEGNYLYSTDAKTRRRYEIQDGIPNMLIEDSTTLSNEEFERVMREHNKGEFRSSGVQESKS